VAADAPGLVAVAPLARWMDEQDLARGEPITLRRLETGYSNEMFEVRRGPVHAVLRRPAHVALDRADEGMVREYRILAALDRTDVPHPPAIALCDDRGVLGRTFYLMGHVDGFTPLAGVPPEFDLPDARAEIALAAVDALAALHASDWQAIGLGDLGRPASFHERQVGRWLRQYHAYPAQEIPGIETLAAWLDAHLPPQWEPGLMHGDYHTGNLLVAPHRPARVAAIVDWETATIGDPLLDLAGFLRFWTEAHAGAPGPGRVEMIRRWEEGTGRTAPDLAYYEALARFRLAVLVEGIYQRSKLDPTRPLAADLHAYAQVLVNPPEG
jgi:aminoglycoside phosphotransferase (APT) family kinase protein